jgi:preprotein translocase SecA subunit
MANILNRLFGDANEREINKLKPLVQEINSLEPEFQSLSPTELRAKTAEFRQRLADGETLDDLLPEAFAAVREAAWRTIRHRHFDVQLMGGIVLHQGKIAEMKTGEGKTLVATLPLYLNALEGSGAHLVTVNDYLSRRDGGWMGAVYHALGMTVGVIAHEFSALYDPAYIATGGDLEDDRLVHWRPCSRREAYAADITYGTNNEFGFDYLRDNMVWDLSQKVQRELHYAIVDEVDNILIDEARTPLIISGQPQAASKRYYDFAAIVRRLRAETDVTIDAKLRAVTLTDEGVERLRRLGVNLPDLDQPEQENPEQAEVMHHLEQALKAQFIFQRDKDYVVKDGQVIIVDEFTGRLMHGRRWSDGLHEAIEAKEGVKIAERTQTMATITFQNYFRMYRKLAGMTGTAMTESEEFFKIYKLEVLAIPTNKPMIRQDLPDLVYKNEAAKFRAIVEEIRELHDRGVPVLVGTISIEKNEQLSTLLTRAGIPHQMLNAKQHEREALVIAQAGRSGAVTIATNMAGRGVDILLGGNPEGLAAKLLETRFYKAAEEFVRAVVGGDLNRANSLIAKTPGLAADSLALAQRLRADYEDYRRSVETAIVPRLFAEKLVLSGFYPRELHHSLEILADAILHEDWNRARQLAREQVFLGDQAIEAIQSLRAFYEVKGGEIEFITTGLFQRYYQAMLQLVRQVLGGRLEDARRLVAETPELSPELITEIQRIRDDCEADHQRVVALGGLHVIGTERHEARRIDNQLRGRAGRQGDPGVSRFFVALDDDLMKRFGGSGIAGIMDRLGLEDDVPIEHNLISKSIEQAQTKVEGYNFDIRKHVVEYDDVMNKQREVIYGERNKILAAETLRDNILDMIRKEMEQIVATYAVSNYSEEWDVDSMSRAIATVLPVTIPKSELTSRSRSELPAFLAQVAESSYEDMAARWNAVPIAEGEPFGLAYGQGLLGMTTRRQGDIMPQVERLLLLAVIDRLWVDHLTILDDLREGIGLRAYGQRDPKIEYQNEAYRMFQELTTNIQRNVARMFFHLGLARVQAAPPTGGQPSAPRRLSTAGPDRIPPVGMATAEGSPLGLGAKGPKLPKKAPCWCGSGKRYEDCHGRRAHEKQEAPHPPAAGQKKFKDKHKRR